MLTVTYNGITYDRFEGAADLLAAGVPPEVVQAAVQRQEWAPTRKLRDAALGACDYAAMPDYPLSEAQRGELDVYRQALRDIPDQGESQANVVWPVKPTFLK